MRSTSRSRWMVPNRYEMCVPFETRQSSAVDAGAGGGAGRRTGVQPAASQPSTSRAASERAGRRSMWGREPTCGLHRGQRETLWQYLAVPGNTEREVVPMAESSPINFTRGVPADESYPLDELLAAARAAVETHGAAALRYGPSTGFAPLRAWIAEWQGTAPEQVLIANGSLQVIEFVCLSLLQPGALVLTEAPTYDRAITLFRRHGMRVAGVPLEGDGPNIQALERLLARERPALFYTIPDFQNPSGATCSADKRVRIAEL